MLGKSVRFGLLIGVVILLAVTLGSVVLAQEAGGTGPDDVLTPGEWRAIVPGEKQWYAFTYDYDQEFVKPIGIYLFGEPDNGVMFTVRTPEQVEEWIMDGENSWIGCCAENEYVRGDRSWSGYFMTSGDYYVVVEPMGIHDEVAYYKLEIDGDNVFLPQESAMMSEVAPALPEEPDMMTAAAPELPEEAVAESPAAAPVMSAYVPMGTGPDDAFALDGAWHKLELGQRHWYAFSFDYVEDMKDEAVDIAMRVEPEYGALFTVRTPEQGQLWRTRGEHEFMGCCAENEFAAGDFSWAGALPETGTYYVVVEHSRIHPSDTVYYALEVDGKNLELELPMMMPMPITVPASQADTLPAIAPEAVAPVAETLPQPGIGPDSALAIDGEWRELVAGAEHWYTFDFDYDDEMDEAIQIGMFVEPDESALFTVRTPENITLWRNEGEVEFVGCCSENEVGVGDVSWAGKFAESGSYFVVVEHDDASPETAYYRLLIDGEVAGR